MEQTHYSRFRSRFVILLATTVLVAVAPRARGIDFFAVGAEVHVSQQTALLQWTPRLARLTDGRVVAVWDDNGDIKARIFNADSSPAGDEFLVDEEPFASTDCYTPDVAALPEGGFIVTWNGFIDTTRVMDVFARAFDGDFEPIAATFRANDETERAQNRPQVEVFDNGNILFVWQHDSGHPTRWDIKYRIFNPNLTPVDTEQHLATNQTANQFRPDIARLGDGNIVAVWDTEESDGEATRYNVRARRIGPLGALGDVVLVNTSEVGDQFDPAVAPLGTAGFVVAWTHDGVFGDLANERGEIRFQRFTFDTVTDAITPSGSETQVNTVTAGSQVEPAVAGWDGGFVVTWTSENNNRYAGDTDINTSEDTSGAGIYARGYDADGNAEVAPFRINLTILNHQYQSTMAALNGFAMIAWTSKGQDGNSDGVYLRRIQTDETLVPADPDPTGALPTPPPVPPVAPTLSMTAPSSIVFNAKRNGKLPPAKVYRIRNLGDSTLTWRVSRRPSWIRVSPAGGSIGAGRSVVVRISVIRAKLPKRGTRINGVARFDATGAGVGDRTLRLRVNRPAPRR